MSRQSWLDGLKAGSEVAVEWRDEVVKVSRVDAVGGRDGHARVIMVGKLRFASDGTRLGYEGYENVPGFCTLQDPDGELSSMATRREVSRNCHIRESLARIMADPETMLSYEQAEKMIRVVYPDYEPVWKL